MGRGWVGTSPDLHGTSASALPLTTGQLRAVHSQQVCRAMLYGQACFSWLSGHTSLFSFGQPRLIIDVTAVSLAEQVLERVALRSSDLWRAQEVHLFPGPGLLGTEVPGWTLLIETVIQFPSPLYYTVALLSWSPSGGHRTTPQQCYRDRAALDWTQTLCVPGCVSVLGVFSPALSFSVP